MIGDDVITLTGLDWFDELCHRFRFTLYDGVSGHPCLPVVIYRLSKLPTT